MKIRTGFVSNSSSSSFLVCYKGEKPDDEKLMELFGVVPGKPAAGMFLPLMRALVGGITRTTVGLLHDSGYTSVEDSGSSTLKQVEALEKDGWAITGLDVDNNDETFQNLLENADFDCLKSFRWW